MADTYIKIRMGKGRAALARPLPGGWFRILATGTEEDINLLHGKMTDGTQGSPENGTRGA